VHPNALRPGRPDDFSYRLYGAYLIIGIHDGNEYGLFPDRRIQVGDAYHSRLVYGKHRQFKPLFFQPFTGVDNGMVFDGRGYYVPSPALEREGCPLYGEIVRLTAASRYDYFAGFGIYKPCY